MTAMQPIHATPCKNCSNEFYRILGPKVEGGQVSIQNPVCTKCNTPLSPVPAGTPVMRTGGTG